MAAPLPFGYDDLVVAAHFDSARSKALGFDEATVMHRAAAAKGWDLRLSSYPSSVGCAIPLPRLDVYKHRMTGQCVLTTGQRGRRWLIRTLEALQSECRVRERKALLFDAEECMLAFVRDRNTREAWGSVFGPAGSFDDDPLKHLPFLEMFCPDLLAEADDHPENAHVPESEFDLLFTSPRVLEEPVR
jgi:hypothetical protein